MKSFGEVDELAQELLRYNKKANKQEPSDPIGDFSKKIMNAINQMIKELSEKSGTEIMRFILEICFLLFLILLARIPVSILIYLGRSVFDILSSPLNRIFFVIWRFILEFAYVILSIVFFIRIFDSRYLKKKNQVKVTKEESIFSEHPKIEEICESFIRIGVFFLKFMAILLLFGVSIYLIGMTIIIGIIFYLISQGVTYFGIYMVMGALFLLGCIFFSILYHFVIDKKTSNFGLIASIVISILLLGGGCAIATFEVSDTEFINGVPNDLKIEVLTEELSMTKDTVFIGNIAHYNVDNSLSTVKVEYEYYPIGTTMSTNVKKVGNYVYLKWNLQKIHINMELLKHMIKDLKEKKVYNYYIEPTIQITANEDNIARIRKNRQKYYQNETNYNSCNFVRTYTVEMIRESYDQKDIIVVLSEYLEDDLATVHLKKEWANNLELGKAYEFTFQTFQQYIDTDIEDIFEENEVINIKQTDKIGIEQRQDYSCTLFY